MITHLFDDIEAKGASRNYNTKPNEQMHGPLKDWYQNRTNFKNVAEQVRCLLPKILLFPITDLVNHRSFE